MAPRPRILLVAPSKELAQTIAPWLESAGHEQVVCSGFPEARAALGGRPNLIITELKLGAYNGLHLAILAGAQGVPSIVIGAPDAVLEQEAARQHAAYLTTPIDAARVLAAVRNLLESQEHTRRSPRKRVPQLDALIDHMHARLLDVSHEGMLIEASTGRESLPSSFVVQVPTFNFACRVERVWMSPSAEAGAGVLCGATLAPSDLDTALAWRALVDGMPGSSVMH
jgi:CheY-like chemotaxis protein